MIWTKINRKNWTPNLRTYTYISSKYLTNMLKGIIIQKNIHFSVRVSRCTTAKLFPISVSYLSRPICPLYLFWIKFTNNNRGFFERKTTLRDITSYTAHYTINILNQSKRVFPILSLSFYIIQGIIGAWSFHDIFFRCNRSLVSNQNIVKVFITT